MAKKKAAHGGARKGAGRKPNPEGKAVTVVVTVPESLVAGLDALAQAKGWGRSQTVTEAIRHFVTMRRRLAPGKKP
jgi:metal-responsive CopG/Arc/MetJ family transcriptional regulator